MRVGGAWRSVGGVIQQGGGAILDPTAQIGRHCYVHQFGPGQLQPLHQPHKLLLAQRQPRVQPPLLPHRCHRLTGVVMRGVQQAVVGQGEDLRVHGAVQRAGTTLLEVGPPAAPDEQSVPSEGHGAVVHHQRHTARRVAGAGPHLQGEGPESQRVPLPNEEVGAGSAVAGNDAAAAGQRRAEGAASGHVIGVAVRVHRVTQRQAELLQQPPISGHRFQHRIDDNRVPRRFVRQDVRISTRTRLEELTQEEPPRSGPGA